MTTRRAFITTLLAAGSAPHLGWAEVGNPDYLAAARTPDGAFALFGLTVGGDVTFRIPLPARGRAGAGHPTRAEAVAFARRPGQFALVIDCATGVVLHHLAPPKGRHFNGHGMFIHAIELFEAPPDKRDEQQKRIGAKIKELRAK